MKYSLLTSLVFSSAALTLFPVADAHSSCGQAGLLAITNLPTLGGSASEADALNASGQITGYSYITGDAAAHIFLYSSNSMFDAGSLGGAFAQGLALNNLGQIAGQAIPAGWFGNHAFLDSGNTVIDLGTLGGGLFSRGLAINDAGTVVGDSLTGFFTTEAFLYAGGSMQGLGTLGGDYSSASAINQAGVVAGDSYTTYDAAHHSFIYTHGTMVDLGTLGGTYSSTFGLNNASSVIGESTLNNGQMHAFIYSGGAMHDLGTLGGTYSSARAINNSGWVTGIATITGDLGTNAFVYHGGVMTGLGTLGGTYSEGHAINNLAQVVGSSTTSGGVLHGFIWQNGSMADLNSLLPAGSGWILQNARFINDSGRIVGQGTYNGRAQWYILDLATAASPPVAVVGPDPTVDCQTPVTLDGSQSVDPDGGSLTYAWTEDGNLLGTNATLTASFDPGTYVVRLTVANLCGETSTTDETIHVIDRTPPSIVSAPGPIVVSAGSTCGGAVPNVLSGIVATDGCTPANQLLLDQNPAAGTVLQDGRYWIAATVQDPAGNTTTTNILLTIADTTAPTITSLTASPTVLWPPNHKTVPVTVSVTASDNCDPASRSKIVSIKANERVSAHDITITGDLTARLAASRDPGGRGRVYTITVQCTDASGNSSTATVKVSVPKDNRAERWDDTKQEGRRAGHERGEDDK